MRGLLVIFLGLTACSEPPVHKGKVTDRWGKPIAGVTIGVTGSAKQLVSGPDGKFTVPVQAADVKLRAGKPGFIKKSMKLVKHAGTENPSSILIAMYPDPETTGFYAVTSSQYAEVSSMGVLVVTSKSYAATHKFVRLNWWWSWKNLTACAIIKDSLNDLPVGRGSWPRLA